MLKVKAKTIKLEPPGTPPALPCSFLCFDLSLEFAYGIGSLAFLLGKLLDASFEFRAVEIGLFLQ